MYSFDHDIGSFVRDRTGTVSDDGLQIRSDPGVGVLKAGWLAAVTRAANGTVADCPKCKICQNNSCVADSGQNGAQCTDDCMSAHWTAAGTVPAPTLHHRLLLATIAIFCTIDDQCAGPSCLGDPRSRSNAPPFSRIRNGVSQYLLNKRQTISLAPFRARSPKWIRPAISQLPRRAKAYVEVL